MLRNKLANQIIVNVQSAYSAVFGAESQQTINAIRALNEVLKNAPVSEFDTIEKTYMSVIR